MRIFWQVLLASALCEAQNVITIKAPVVQHLHSTGSGGKNADETIALSSDDPAHAGSLTLPSDVTSSLTGEALALETASNGDLYVYFSPELQKDLASVLQGPQCTQKESAACEQAVQQLLQQNSVEVEKRFLGGGVIVGLLAISAAQIIESWKSSGSFLSQVARVPLQQVESLKSYASQSPQPTGVAFVDPSFTYTASVPTYATTATGVVPDVTVLTAAVNNHEIGDAHITMPTALAAKAQLVLADSTKCEGSSERLSKRAISDCLVAGAANLMDSAHPGGPLYDLVLVQHQIPLFRNPDIVLATGRAIALAQRLAGQLRVSQRQAATFGAVAVALAAAVLLNNQQLGPDVYFPASDLTTGPIPTQDITLPPSMSATPTSSSSTQSSSCPDPSDPALVCQSKYCSGNLASSTCASGSRKGCRCTISATNDYAQTGMFNTTMADIQSSVLNSVISSLAAITPTPACNLTTADPPVGDGPKATPTAWCGCTQDWNPFISHNYSANIFATRTGPSQSVCAYDTMPATAITVNYSKHTGAPTKCSLGTTIFTSSLSGGAFSTGVPYSSCTCNDGSMYPVSTLVMGKSASPYCPDQTFSSTQSAPPAPPPPALPAPTPPLCTIPNNAPADQLDCKHVCGGHPIVNCQMKGGPPIAWPVCSCGNSPCPDRRCLNWCAYTGQC